MRDHRAMRGWKVACLTHLEVPVYLLGRLEPCDFKVRHYVATDVFGELHCLEYLNGRLVLCVDELNYRWDCG